MTFHFGSKPAPADAATRLNQCREQLAAAVADSEAKRARYLEAIQRSAGDVSIKTEAAEVRRAHEAYLQSKAIADRAQDHVDAAEQLHREALAREANAAEDAAWERADELCVERIRIAEEFAAAAETVARCQARMGRVTRELYDTMPVSRQPTSGSPRSILADWNTPLIVEMRRLEILPDKVSRLVPLKPLVDTIRGHREMVARLRSAAA